MVATNTSFQGRTAMSEDELHRFLGIIFATIRQESLLIEAASEETLTNVIADRINTLKQLGHLTKDEASGLLAAVRSPPKGRSADNPPALVKPDGSPSLSGMLHSAIQAYSDKLRGATPARTPNDDGSAGAMVEDYATFTLSTHSACVMGSALVGASLGGGPGAVLGVAVGEAACP
jgi:hypothetical protein